MILNILAGIGCLWVAAFMVCLLWELWELIAASLAGIAMGVFFVWSVHHFLS